MVQTGSKIPQGLLPTIDSSSASVRRPQS